MTDRVGLTFSDLPNGARLAHIRLTAPRANALEPGLLADLHAALDQCADAQAVLLSGGRNFSTGGDVAAFLAAAKRGEAQAYAMQVVPPLQELVLRLVSMPALVAVAARGAITGGSAGLLFAADLAVVAPDVFIQPYYARMGFAPDGGWAALLPELIGIASARSWLNADQRVMAPALPATGLAADLSDTPEDHAIALLGDLDIGTRLAAKAVIWDAPRRALLEQRLAAETRAFVARITRPDVAARMERFVRPAPSAPDV
ncbi:enoyl-CoA hydratase/isomerase family protein [Actibacterium sp. XHP0104]|uniref:enoyl-CoA hydratase/isomerase family protein n=1 Tax=Actibacterium sp. XHP0104 TaxID=2984335 RepID=UPI0021E97D49|nr:enoyl-CoA hydratase/isomerase family protein [Actibacterium sp. XHP0104]MCV2882530.1 enoyl-CoA hydratase/isomerase family protein [Actibacterium sp. XHP0104]